MLITPSFDHLYAGEHNVRTVDISVEERFAGDSVRLSFHTPCGKTYLSDLITLVNGEATYSLPGAVTDGPGRLLIQLLVYNGTSYIAKSKVWEFSVFPSVNKGICESPCADGLISLGALYDAYLTHDHDTEYYRKEQTDSLLSEAAVENAERFLSKTDADADFLKKTDAAASYAPLSVWNAQTLAALNGKTQITVVNESAVVPGFDVLNAAALRSADGTGITVLMNEDGIHPAVKFTFGTDGSLTVAFEYVHGKKLRGISYKAEDGSSAPAEKVSDSATDIPDLSDLAAALDDYQPALTSANAGEGISIENGVISSALTLPTALSDLTNDSGFITLGQAQALTGASPDWDENDPDEPGYVQNRTHYRTYSVIYPACTVTGFAPDSINGEGSFLVVTDEADDALPGLKDMLTGGNMSRVSVRVDGIMFRNLDVSSTSYGGISIRSSFGAVPYFYLSQDNYSTVVNVKGFGSAESHVFEILTAEPEYHKLNNNYLDLDPQITRYGVRPVPGSAVFSALAEKADKTVRVDFVTENGGFKAEIAGAEVTGAEIYAFIAAGKTVEGHFAFSLGGAGMECALLPLVSGTAAGELAADGIVMFSAFGTDPATGTPSGLTVTVGADSSAAVVNNVSVGAGENAVTGTDKAYSIRSLPCTAPASPGEGDAYYNLSAVPPVIMTYHVGTGWTASVPDADTLYIIV